MTRATGLKKKYLSFLMRHWCSTNSFRFCYFFDYEMINSTLLFRIQCCICYIAIVSYANLFTLRMFVVFSQHWQSYDYISRLKNCFQLIVTKTAGIKCIFTTTNNNRHRKNKLANQNATTGQTNEIKSRSAIFILRYFSLDKEKNHSFKKSFLIRKLFSFD